jgi:hypothetical protein
MEYNRMNLNYNRFRSKSSSAARLFPGPYWVAPDERFRFSLSPLITTQSLERGGWGCLVAVIWFPGLKKLKFVQGHGKFSIGFPTPPVDVGTATPSLISNNFLYFSLFRRKTTKFGMVIA